MSPSFSVVVCTFNGERYLREQLESITRQTLKPSEIIISDDCSSDATHEIIREFKRRFTDISIVEHFQKQNVGVIRNFEQAIRLANHPFIFLSDQDDVWHPTKIERFNSFIVKNKISPDSSALIYSAVRIIDADGNEVRGDFVSRPSGTISPYELLFRNWIAGCSMLLTRSLCDKALPLPNRVSMHDHWFGLVAMATGGIYRISEELVDYRQHGNNTVGAGQSYFHQLQKFAHKLTWWRVKILNLRVKKEQVIALHERFRSAPRVNSDFLAAACSISQGELKKGFPILVRARISIIGLLFFVSLVALKPLKQTKN